MSERILVVEDDPTLRRILLDNLIFEGYRAEAVSDGKAAIAHVRASAPDLVVLDLTLPDFDGLDLCPVLRQSGKVPIIILSARGQKADKLKGLKLGADDYITKPFDLQELLARISAVLRRSHPALEKLMIGKLTIDFRSQRASSGQAPVHLTHREFELLRYLAERREKVVHRLLVREVQFRVRPGDDVGIALREQSAVKRRPYQAPVSCQIDRAVLLHACAPPRSVTV